MDVDVLSLFVLVKFSFVEYGCLSKPVGRRGAIARSQRWLMVDGMNHGDDVGSDRYGSEVRTNAQRLAEVRERKKMGGCGHARQIDDMMSV